MLDLVEWWSQIWQCSYFWHFYGGRVYVCGLRMFTKKVYYVLIDTRVKRLRFLEWQEVPEL